MSCNGCRVLRKGCREDCMLKQCLEWLDDAQAQANATVFVAKFYGRAGLMSSISSVAPSQRPSLFQSLLFEAVGRTVNPVSGAVGLLWTGNWHVCRTAVMTVLRGGTIESLPAFEGGALETEFDNVSEYCSFRQVDHGSASEAETPPRLKRKRSRNDLTTRAPADDHSMYRPPSEESEMTTYGSTSPSDGHGGSQGGERKLLRLFV